MGRIRKVDPGVRLYPLIGEDLSQLVNQLEVKLLEIVTAMNFMIEGQTDYLKFEVRTLAPDSPQDGDVAFADGTSWNPGSGKGLYERRGGAWYKL